MAVDPDRAFEVEHGVVLTEDGPGTFGGDDDPSVVGLDVVRGSVYLRSNGEVWKKYGSLSTEWSQLAAATPVSLPAFMPGGRLTLSSNTPVMTANVIGATTIYYTPYAHDLVGLYDGTKFEPTQFTELSQALSDSTKSPAASAASSLYDMFVWNDGGTLRCTRGPAWSSATARGVGAGTTELQRVLGRYVNAFAITNGPAAQRGLYVGTIATNASNQVDWNLGGIAAGGSAASLFVWNTYNRVAVRTFVGDSTNSWTYNVNTIRSSNNSTNMRATMVVGLSEDIVEASFLQTVVATSDDLAVGIGLDSTTAFASQQALGYGDAISEGMFVSRWKGHPGIGRHFIQALEVTISGSVTYYGDNNIPTRAQNGLVVEARM